MAIHSQDRGPTKAQGAQEARAAAPGRARALARMDAQAGSGHDGGHAVGRQARRRRFEGVADGGRARLLILALVIAGAAALLGVLDTSLRPPAAVNNGTAPPVMVVWRAPGQDAVRISEVDAARWHEFVASRRETQMRSRKAILDAARGDMTTALTPIFRDMRGRVKDYIGWFYFFPTTYRMAFTGLISAVSREQGDERSTERAATEGLNRLMQDRFVEVVVMPERYGPAIETQAREVLRKAIVREREAAEEENRALSAFMAENGKIVEGGKPASGGAAAIAWEALGIPASAASMPAPPDGVALIKADPALEALQTTVTTEGMMLAARQLTRRAVQAGVSDLVHSNLVPILAGAFGPAEALMAPAVGIGAFLVGVGAEWGTVKARQAAEGQRLSDLAESVVDRLRENQSRALADGVAKRIESWLGG